LHEKNALPDFGAASPALPLFVRYEYRTAVTTKQAEKRMNRMKPHLGNITKP